MTVEETAVPLPNALEHYMLNDGEIMIRPASESEYNLVGQTLVKAFTYKDSISESYYRRLTSIAERSENEDVWVAQNIEGTVLGAYLTPKPNKVEDEGYFGFNTLGVLPAKRGKGLGHAFVRHALALGRFYGFNALLIHSGPNMVDAHRLYQQCGFVRHRELENIVVDGNQRLLVFIANINEALKE